MKTDDLKREWNAMIEWWKAAGIDNDYRNDATDWLETTSAIEAAESSDRQLSKRVGRDPAPPPKKNIGGDRSDWHDTLPQFQEWWTNNSLMDDAGSYPVVPPSGETSAALMIIVDEPEEGDTDQLMSGPEGRLLRNISNALGFHHDEIYYASALRKHTPMPDWNILKDAGLGDLVVHHARLVDPKRILTFGRNIPPLLGNDTAQAGAHSFELHHGERRIPILSVGSLAELLRSALRRKRFWEHCLEWMED